jgi:hypothetical protein
MPTEHSQINLQLGITVGDPWVPDLKPTPLPTKYPYPQWVGMGPVGIKGTIPMMWDPWV